MTHLTNTKRDVVEMFMDKTPGESTLHNRLVTREDNGKVILLGYGWLKLAQYDESREAVTVFTGHAALRSKTVSRWLNQVISIANERGRDTIISGESPVEDTPNDTTDFIGNYISMSGNRSAVERDAQEAVRQSLTHLG